MKTPDHIKDTRADLAHVEKNARRRRRWLGALITLAALVLFGFFGLPPIVRAQAVKQLTKTLHREVSIGRVRINPLVLSVAVEGLAIKDRDGGPFVGWKRLFVDFDSWSLFTGEWRFQEITLDGFSGRAVMNKDGSFNFSDLVPAPSCAPVPEAPAKPGRPLYVGKLAVTSAAAGFADHTRVAPFSSDVGPLSFTLTDFRTAGDPKAPYAFSAVTESGETLDWRGRVSINPVRSVGEFSVGKVALKKYAPYYAGRVRADVLGGTLDVAAHYAIDLTEGAKVMTLDNAVITLANLQIAERGATTPVIELPSLIIEGLSADALKPSASIKRIALDRAHLRVRRDADGAINLLAMLAPGAAVTPPVPAPATPAPPAALPDVKLGEFSITKLGVEFEDRTTPTPAKNTIDRLDVSVKNFSLSEPASPVAVKVAAVLAMGGELGVEGAVVRAPLSADLAIKVAAVRLAGLTPYIEPLLNLRIADGSVSVGGRARVAGTAATFKGDASVNRFSTVDGARVEDFVKFEALTVDEIDAATEPLTVKVGAVTLVDPVVRFVINADKSTNVSTVLRTTAPVADAGKNAVAPSRKTPAAATAANTAASAAPAPVWSLGKFTLTNATVSLADRSIKPVVQTALNQFSGTVTGLSSANAQRADVDFHGKVDGVGSIAVTGKLDARAATPDPAAATDITVDVKGVDLSPLSPYVGAYAGYELARGSLAVDLKTRLAQRKIDSANVVTLNQFTLGSATNSPEATKLPVRLGIALLKDLDGNIVIDLPVNGGLDDPNFKIGRVVLRVVVNLLVKAATSPFSLIGSMFGGGGDELAYQEFAPGAVTPLDAEVKKTETLRKALKARPTLSLDITGGFDALADAEVLRQQRLDQQVHARLWEELRAKDPAAPLPDRIIVSEADTERVIAGIFAAKFPAGAVVDPAGAVIAVPPPQPVVVTPQTTVRASPRGLPVSRATAPLPAPKSFAPAASIVTVSTAMQVQDIATAPSLAEMRRLLAAGITITDDDLRQLATMRARNVRDALLAGGEVEAARLFLTPVSAQGKGAKVLLQLK